MTATNERNETMPEATNLWSVTVTLQSRMCRDDGTRREAPIDMMYLKAGSELDALGNVLNALQDQDPDLTIGTEVLAVRCERVTKTGALAPVEGWHGLAIVREQSETAAMAARLTDRLASTGKTLGEMTQAERSAAVGQAITQLTAELGDAARMQEGTT